MPALVIYLIKVNIALLIFCAGYYAVLRHLTFYNLNRVYLVTAIIFATLYPLVNLTDFLNRHEDIAKPVQVIIINWQGPIRSIAKTFLGHDVWFWLQVAFWTGVIIFAVRLLTQLLSLRRLHKRSEPAQLHQYVIRVIKGDINPFSFWRNIYINPENHPATELISILEHEQIHVNEWHTLDILLGEISAVFYWFNPGIWLMKRAIRENIEFITDQKILQKGVDSKAYQYSLLSVNFGAQGNTIVNHFNISTIKKRIMMMNAKRSRNINITRYLFLIPAVMVLLLIFSVSKAELKKAVNSSAHMIKAIKTEITKISFTNTKTTAPHDKTGFLSAVNLFSVENETVKAGEKTQITGKSSVDTFKHSLTTTSGKNIIDTFYRIKLNGAFDKFYAASRDTNKKSMTVTLTTRGSHADIYINGVKMTENDLNAIDPRDVSNIDVMKNSKTSPNGAIYIITKSHEINVHASNKNDTVIYFNGRAVYVKAMGTDRIRAIGPKPPDVVGYSYAYSTASPITKVRINGKTFDATGRATTKTVANGDTVYTTSALTAARAKSPVIDSLLDRMTGLTVNPNGTVTKVVTGYRLGGPTRIVNVRASASSISFADKLIIIDGKEATAKQLKKVSADKINSVSNLSGDAATAAYGDKGKNGVVVITTKK